VSEIVRTEHLTKYYGKTRGIEGVDLTVEEGEVFGFLGPNGAGKTTTIQTLLNFLRPGGAGLRLHLSAGADVLPDPGPFGRYIGGGGARHDRRLAG
jgi:ABC-2 type transport system ATP-binding protein